MWWLPALDVAISHALPAVVRGVEDDVVVATCRPATIGNTFSR